MVAHLLPLMSGDITLPKLEDRSKIWVEKIRSKAVEDYDKVMARFRLRGHVTAYRMTVCLMLCQVCQRLIREFGLNGAEQRLKADPDLWKQMLLKAQTPALLDAYEIIAESQLDNELYYFREKVQKAYDSSDYNLDNRTRTGKNDTIYESLPDEFTVEQAYQKSVAFKGVRITRNTVHMMLKNWRKQGIAVLRDDGNYIKKAH